ncbi:O-antigen ligase [Methylosinus sp. sav-2]|jgi:O-antigen ligase|uniref:O-antigen ligase family protein n=1 Tax=unclassified Methylosinus TaxID=2624500 RepID=UPI000463FCC2|nr:MULTISPECIES: O-antigen ligase family protein [unclassified Methylosinus]TDX67242.1 O-antigen ligase [Methylosinus sp. sav-2]
MRKTEMLCGAAIAASLIFGGATQKGGVSDVVVQLAALPLLALVLPDIGRSLAGRGWIAALLGVIVAVPLLQLIPLAPSVWNMLPGRDAVADTYRIAELSPPWLGLSVAPWATSISLLALTAPIAIFLGVLSCHADERRRLMLLATCIGVATVLLEVMQIVQGQKSALRFHSGVDVGLFVNRNHTAAFLYSLTPLAAYALERYLSRRSAYGVLAVFALLMLFTLGLMMTGSRSALLFGLVSAALTYALILGDRLGGARAGKAAIYFVIAPALIVTGLLAPYFGLTQIIDRFMGADIAADARWKVFRVSFETMQAFFPLGSGLGTFDRVYPLFEPTSMIVPAIVNHAHNDILELAMELGLVGILLVLCWLAATLIAALRNFRESDATLRKERFAALIVVGLLFAHSTIDYPMRTSALAAVFAMCCAVICKKSSRAARRDEHASRRTELVHEL